MTYDISYKNLIDSKSLCIGFDKMDGFIRIFDGTRQLTLLGSEKVMLFTTELDTCKSKMWRHIYFYHYFSKIKANFYF